MVPYLWNGVPEKGSLSLGKLLGLFLLPLLVLRGIRPPGVYRALQTFGETFRIPMTGVSEITMLPMLLGRFRSQWRSAKLILSLRTGHRHQPMTWLSQLRVLFWRSHEWPEKVGVSYRFRAGEPQVVLNKERESNVGWKEGALVLLAYLCALAAAFERSF